MSTALTVIRRNDWPAAIAQFNADATDRPRDDDEQHARLVQWFEESERSTADARRLAERDRAYVDGDQWTEEERKALNARGQPVITINKCRPKLDLLCGLERRARTDPKAFPRTPQEEDRADAATQALRYIADDNSFPGIRSRVFEDMLVEGYGGVEVGLEDDGQNGANITLTRVPWDRIWYDPHSRAHDFSDARYLGLVVWMDRDQLYDLYPDAGDIIEGAFDIGMGDVSYHDRPEDAVWSDSKRTRVRVVECHWSDAGEWYSATFTRTGFLTPTALSKFKDRKGRSACRLILQSAYIDLENNRYGMVRDLISLQDEINKRRSKALHLLSVHQVVAEKGAVQDVDKARREVARPDGYVEVTPGLKFEIQNGGELATGQFHLLQHATAEMQLAGPNAAMSGTDPRELSGRAILAQQAGGATQNEPLADSLRMWSRRVYEMCWMAAREYWTAGKWVRVTDELQQTRWVGINHEVTLQDELAKMSHVDRAIVMQQMQIMPGDPRLMRVIRIENDITDLDVDIMIQEGQDIPALQAEDFQSLVQLASLQPGLIPGDVLVAASSLRNKEDILKRMQQHQQQQAQVQQRAGQLATQHSQADIAGKQAKAAADMALARERTHNTIRSIHDVHADFSAPPYGQPHVAPDTAPQLGAPGAPENPEQMAVPMAIAHHAADLAQKQAQLEKTRADTAKSSADAMLTAAKAGQVPHDTLATRAGVLNQLVETQRLARTPIPQPGQGGG